MNADKQDIKFKHKELTAITWSLFRQEHYSELSRGEIIEIFYRVYNKLGYGFLEKVYENAMMIEFKREGIPAKAQTPIKVYYDDREIIGEYTADILVDDKIMVEIKAIKKLAEENEAQLLNYLKATNVEVGLLFNFGPEPEIKRRAFDNSRKPACGRQERF
ncbi:MAG: GxxExxY protein [bacterium]|nr:GxxExxY protein [bacterium]